MAGKDWIFTGNQHDSDQCDSECASALMDLCARYKMPKSRFLSLLPRNKLVDILNRIMKVLKGRKFCNIAKFGFRNTEKL